jgi:hypothetical protein
MRMRASLFRWMAAAIAALCLTPPIASSFASDSCPGHVAGSPPRVIPAAVREAALQADQVGITPSATRPS